MIEDKSKPIFTTEDGKEIFYGDVYWNADILNGTIFSCQAISEFETRGKLTFSTKEIAEATLKLHELEERINQHMISKSQKENKEEFLQDQVDQRSST